MSILKSPIAIFDGLDLIQLMKVSNSSTRVLNEFWGEFYTPVRLTLPMSVSVSIDRLSKQ